MPTCLLVGWLYILVISMLFNILVIKILLSLTITSTVTHADLLARRMAVHLQMRRVLAIARGAILAWRLNSPTSPTTCQGTGTPARAWAACVDMDRHERAGAVVLDGRTYM